MANPEDLSAYNPELISLSLSVSLSLSLSLSFFLSLSASLSDPFSMRDGGRDSYLEFYIYSGVKSVRISCYERRAKRGARFFPK